MTWSRRELVLGAGATAIAASAHSQTPAPPLSGRLVQGGYALGRTNPRASILWNGEAVTAASAGGVFAIGFDRDEPASGLLAVETRAGRVEQTLAIAPGQFDIQRIDGLPESQVSPSDPALLRRIEAEAERKAAGFASRADRDDFKTGFIAPLDRYRLSARFGGQRILNGEAKRPHYGADLAAPTGTPIRAPAAGLVSFAEQGLHFEGGLVLIDHGQGVVTAYLHMSRLDVVRGQDVVQGQVIGAVGAEGRATGPHLCWRLTWRGRHLDPTLWMVGKA